MTNQEKHIKELTKIWEDGYQFSVNTRTGVVHRCTCKEDGGIECAECLFDYNGHSPCADRRNQWLNTDCSTVKGLLMNPEYEFLLRALKTTDEKFRDICCNQSCSTCPYLPLNSNGFLSCRQTLFIETLIKECNASIVFNKKED